MASIFWTVAARDDLRGVIRFISQDSPTYAAVTADRIMEAVERLNDYPELGRVVPEYDSQSLRELVVGNYRVVYRLRRKRVGIVAVVHASRDLLRRRANEPWDFG